MVVLATRISGSEIGMVGDAKGMLGNDDMMSLTVFQLVLT